MSIVWGKDRKGSPASWVGWRPFTVSKRFTQCLHSGLEMFPCLVGLEGWRFDKGIDDVNVHLEDVTHTLLTPGPMSGRSIFCLKQHQT